MRYIQFISLVNSKIEQKKFTTETLTMSDDKQQLKEDDKKEEKFIVSYDDMYDSKYQEAQTSSLILEILKNIRPGVDLFRIPLPAWVLEKRSFLEKLTDLFLHQQLVLK